MRKTSVQLAAKLRIYHGKNRQLSTGVVDSFNLAVDKPLGFTHCFTALMRSQNRQIISVIGRLLPTFHTPYYNYYLINELLVSNRSLA